MTRKKMEIDWDLVEKRMEAGCSAKEIAAVLHCDTDTLYDRSKERYGKSFSVISAEFYSKGDANIRSIQYAKVLQGNLQMLFFLGKERLGQGKEEVKVSPFEDTIAIRHENMILKAELQELKEKYVDKSETGQEFQRSDASL